MRIHPQRRTQPHALDTLKISFDLGLLEQLPQRLFAFFTNWTLWTIIPSGFACPRCGNPKAWPLGTLLYECSGCHYQLSVIAGTIFQDTHKPLTLWFRAMWRVTGQKNGASALGLKRILGLGSYRTAWAWLHKLRRAMIHPGRDQLSGIVEVDETFIGGEKPGKRGRGAAGKVLVGLAVEDKAEKGLGRIRLGILTDASADSLTTFVKQRIIGGSTVRTDDWPGYNSLASNGYRHVTVNSIDLRLPPLVASLLKRWLLGTHQGAVSHEHLAYYLDEYTFRFNRRTSAHRGKLFMRLLENAVQIDPIAEGQIVRRVRGRKPKVNSPVFLFAGLLCSPDRMGQRMPTLLEFTRKQPGCPVRTQKHDKSYSASCQVLLGIILAVISTCFCEETK